MQEENHGPRWVYAAILVVLIVVVLGMGFRAFEGSQNASATATTQLGKMIENSTQFYATQTSEVP